MWEIVKLDGYYKGRPSWRKAWPKTFEFAAVARSRCEALQRQSLKTQYKVRRVRKR
jgi:hypothetical protein